MALLDVRHLTFTYPGETRPAVQDVSFSLEAGDFAVLCGATGSGKSTLLRCLKREIAPKGVLTGALRSDGVPLRDLSARDSACRIGFVAQRPEAQIVTDKVWHEMAFGLENLGVPSPVIRRRIAETASYFGLQDWFDRDTAELSGGQKQLLCLASVMVMQPDVLLLDEPTAQLDPIAAQDFLSTLARLNLDLSLTILLIEHRLNTVLPLSNRLLAMENGQLIACGGTRSVAEKLKSHPVLRQAMPDALRLAALLGTEEAPLTVGEGRSLLRRRLQGGRPQLTLPAPPAGGEEALAFSHVFFRYAREGADVLRDLTLTVRSGEFVCLLGGNGTGKTTALSCAAGLLRPYAGRISVFGQNIRKYTGQKLYQHVLVLLPQDVQTLFLRDTVRDELADAQAAPPPALVPLLDRHPYDLSGGEQQLLGLAKVLAAAPRLLLLDEPTKGLDPMARAQVGDFLRSWQAETGGTVVCVTHDPAFAADCATRCILFFRGEAVSDDPVHTFFAGNRYYTTPANLIARGVCDEAITVEEVASLCRSSEGGAAS